MKGIVLLMLVYLFRCEGAVLEKSEQEVQNKRPIIGILAQEQSFYLDEKFPIEKYTSYIAASYVKDIESAGARVVPIMIGKDRDYYENLLSKLNGVLLPGGATFFNQSNGYADAGQYIYEFAQKLNDRGDYFPIFGTCLGFELLIVLASGTRKEDNRVTCHSYGNLPLEFTKDYRESKMFADAPEEVVRVLSTEDSTINYHQFCITDNNLISHNLTKDWRVMSHNADEYGVRFISSVEHTRYPIYGVQFHPEKPAFEWKLSKHYTHTPSAVKANRYFMDFFVGECQKNRHSFADEEEENKYLIYKYTPKFTGAIGSAYLQCYFFEPRGPVVN